MGSSEYADVKTGKEPACLPVPDEANLDSEYTLSSQRNPQFKSFAFKCPGGTNTS